MISDKQQLFEDQRRNIAVRREANDKIAEFTLKMSQLKGQFVLEEDVINSLDHALTALYNIEGIIEAARMYWEKMHNHCKGLSTRGISQIVNNAKEKKDDETKQKLYRSTIFKRGAVNLYAKCIAVVSKIFKNKFVQGWFSNYEDEIRVLSRFWLSSNWLLK